MSQESPSGGGPGPFEISVDPGSAGSANLVYVLYLLGLVLGGISAIIGVVIAYMNKDQAPDWLKSHYVYQIHTFWKLLLYGVISSLLTVVLIGFLLLLVLLVWYIMRCVRGLSAVARREPIADPAAWGF
jgi:uncharacterized membrane protein